MTRKRQSSATHDLRSGLPARLEAHRDTARDSLKRIRRHWGSNIMTMAVIGIALLLPALLSLALINLSQLGGELRQSGQMQLYLDDAVSEQAADELREQLLEDNRVSTVDYISREQAAADFRQHSGMGDILSALSGNPLPASLVLQPASANPQEVRALAADLAARPEVEQLQIDLEWLQRLDRLLDFASRVTIALAVILALAVLFVVGNTIRLAIENRRSEIMVVKLVGGTDGFVARPFLYTGFWLGLGGGLLALLMLFLLLWLLTPPLAGLLATYDSQWQLHGPGAGLILALGTGGALLGWLGALVSVRLHLRHIEPR